ncbi:MAG: flagellar motor protein MotB [Clostridia bacterium]|nr:flagellar motor protein MotB [[Bacteroides] pectinophilus]MDD5873986.1 flagellar motor protein MotB [Clostridia bacterium]
MAKIKKREEKGGGAAWMNTFSDLMNLLLCFFVMLFAMSDPNQEKFQQLSASLASTFSIFNAGSVSMGDGVLIGSGASQLNELAIYYNNMGMNSEGEITQEEIKDAAQQIQEAGLQESEHMAENIEKQLEQNMLSDDVEVKATSKYVMLNLNSGILFDSGKSELKTEAVTLLDKVSSILWEYNDNMIAVEGHTDNNPIHNSKYPDNTMLSLYRAYSVFTYLTDQKGFDASTMLATGRGESVPIASNATAEGRAQNRRVEIKIYNSFE